MKTALLISLPLLALTGTLSVLGINQAITNIPTPQPLISVAPLKTVSVDNSVQVMKVSPQPVEAPQTAPTQVVGTTNEDLIAQYGWNVGPYRSTIDQIIQFYPQFFTDELRATSFAYIKNASPSYEEGSITYFRTMLSSRSWSVQAWVNEGLKYGLDTSVYQ